MGLVLGTIEVNWFIGVLPLSRPFLTLLAMSWSLGWTAVYARFAARKSLLRDELFSKSCICFTY